MNLEGIKNNKKSYLDRIAKGEVLRYLQKSLIPVTSVEIAADLNLPLPLLRAELYRLIDQDLVVVNSQASTGSLNSCCLKYQLKEVVVIHHFLKHSPRKLTLQDIAEEMQDISEQAIFKTLNKLIEQNLVEKSIDAQDTTNNHKTFYQCVL